MDNVFLKKKVADAMSYSINDLSRLRLQYFDLVGVVHSVVKTTKSCYVLRLTRLEEIPLKVHTIKGFFHIRPEMIDHFEVEPVFDVPNKSILDILVYDEHIDIVKTHLKSGDIVLCVNLHYLSGSAEDSITLHGANKNIQQSRERGVYVIDDDFEDNDAFNLFRLSMNQRIVRRPVQVAPTNDNQETEEPENVNPIAAENVEVENRQEMDDFCLREESSGQKIADSAYESMSTQ